MDKIGYIFDAKIYYNLGRNTNFKKMFQRKDLH